MEQDVSFPTWNIKDVAAALIIVFAVSYLLGWITGPVLNQRFSLAERMFLSGIVQTFLFIGTVFAVIFLRYKGDLHQLGLGKIISVSTIKKGIEGGLLLFTVVLFAGIFVSTVAPVQSKPQPFADLLARATTPFEVFVPFFVGGILAPLGEEIYFRGFAYPVLKRKLGTGFGILASAVLFSALHFDALRFLPITIGGMGLAWLYERTGYLVIPIIAHSVWNLIMLGLVFLAYRGPSFF